MPYFGDLGSNLQGARGSDVLTPPDVVAVASRALFFAEQAWSE
jgi:hypothetical protein